MRTTTVLPAIATLIMSIQLLALPLEHPEYLESTYGIDGFAVSAELQAATPPSPKG